MQGSAGHGTAHNKALTLWHGGQGQVACVPWVAGCICFEAESGQPHPFTGSGAPPRGRPLPARFSGVVSAEPLDETKCVYSVYLCVRLIVVMIYS